MRRIALAAAVLAAALLRAAPATAGAALAGWPTLAGSGLFTLPGADTLRGGGVALSVNIDNRDRDPLGLDLLDGALVAVVGLGERTEAYAYDVFTRVASLPEAPALPPAPLDLVAAPGAALPTGPFHSHYSLTPYVDKRGRARFDAFVPGDLVLGVKRRLVDQRGARPALAAALEAKLPLSSSADDLGSGAGTGGTDLRARAVAQWTAGRAALVASAAYTRTAGGALGDRFVRVDAGGDARAEDRELQLADRVMIGAGLRIALTDALALVAEGSADADVGARTPTLDTATPFDVLAGLQARAGGARLQAALRYHGNALPSGQRRRSPLAGLLDVTDVAEAELAAYLARVGAGAAAPLLRPGTHRVLALPAGSPAPPPGARVLAPEYAIRSEHNVGFVIALGWTF
jgi:hypothetical protein